MVQGAPRTPVIRRFWVHSVASATIGQDFARFFRINPQLVYIGAVLHDLGRLGLLAAHPEEYTTLALSSHESTDAILAAEQAGFGMTHCHAGALLAGAWSLPDPVQHIAEQHHQAGSDHEVVALVQLCCRLADDLEFQAIHRRDIQAPEETIKALAPGHLREQLTGRLDDVKTAILRAMETLDF
jgi:HD-like signal output (HDOD) protein